MHWLTFGMNIVLIFLFNLFSGLSKDYCLVLIILNNMFLPFYEYIYKEKK